jgi:hypothetical protein
VKAGAALALLAFVPAAASAQGAKSGSPVRIEFRAMTEDGETVADVKAADLSLKVNGKGRTIQSLSFFQTTGDGADKRALPPPYATNAVGQHGRVLHVLIDDDSISPGREVPVKEAMRLITAELSPSDRIGLLTTQATINIAPTADVTKVRLASAGFAGRGSTAETDTDAQCRTRRVLAAVGTMLSLTGDAPTTIVIFSSGISVPQVKQIKIGSSTATGTSDVCPVEPDDFANIGSLAAITHADLYLFHVLEGRADHSSTQDAGFESLAGVTGAEFVRLTGNVQPAVSRLLRETAAYYVATFDPEPGERNGQALRVELKSGRDAVKLRTRPSIQMTKEAAAKAAPSPKDMLRVATAYHDLPLRSAAFSSRMPGSDEIKVVALFENVEGAPLATASVGLFDAKGTLKKQWTAQKDDLAKPLARADLLAPAGSYRVRIAAVDGAGRPGTADYDLDAQLARADPLKLSTLVVGTQPPGGGFVPRLEFTNEPVAIALLEIYGIPKGGNVTVNLDVVSTPEGQPLATAETQLGRGSSDDARTAIGGFGIGDLPPGDYLMRAVVLLDGKPVGKAVRTLRKAK